MMCARLVRWARLWRDRDHGQGLRHLEKLSRLSLREQGGLVLPLAEPRNLEIQSISRY